MNRLWAPLVILGLASATAGWLACSRSTLQAARPDGSNGRPVSDALTEGQILADVALADAQVPADAAPSDSVGRSICGNGLLEPGEECDDGNTVFGDGCTKVCKLDRCAASGGVAPGCSSS